jgi:hypothetical protein
MRRARVSLLRPGDPRRIEMVCRSRWRQRGNLAAPFPARPLSALDGFCGGGLKLATLAASVARDQDQISISPTRSSCAHMWSCSWGLAGADRRRAETAACRSLKVLGASARDAGVRGRRKGGVGRPTAAGAAACAAHRELVGTVRRCVERTLGAEGERCCASAHRPRNARDTLLRAVQRLAQGAADPMSTRAARRSSQHVRARRSLAAAVVCRCRHRSAQHAGPRAALRHGAWRRAGPLRRARLHSGR